MPVKYASTTQRTTDAVPLQLNFPTRYCKVSKMCCPTCKNFLRPIAIGEVVGNMLKYDFDYKTKTIEASHLLLTCVFCKTRTLHQPPELGGPQTPSSGG